MAALVAPLRWAVCFHSAVDRLPPPLHPYFIFVLFRLGREGVQALHHAAAGGQEDVVRLLHGAGAPLGPQSGAGTPLHWACGEGRASCVALLADLGADLDAANAQGLTPLLMAVGRRLLFLAALIFYLLLSSFSLLFLLLLFFFFLLLFIFVERIFSSSSSSSYSSSNYTYTS